MFLGRSEIFSKYYQNLETIKKNNGENFASKYKFGIIKIFKKHECSSNILFKLEQAGQSIKFYYRFLLKSLRLLSKFFFF